MRTIQLNNESNSSDLNVACLHVLFMFQIHVRPITAVMEAHVWRKYRVPSVTSVHVTAHILADIVNMSEVIMPEKL